MNKFFYSFMLFLFVGSISVFAQDFGNKGVWELGGAISFSSTTIVVDGESADDAITSFGLEPYIGYFVINCLELGLIPSYGTTSVGDVSSSSFGIYFAPAWNFNLQSKLFPFIEGRIGYNTSTYDSGENETTLSGLAYGGRAGVKYQLGNSALVQASLGYNMYTMNPEDWDGDRNGTNVFDFLVGFTVFLGK